jgi:hypothetical protein
MMGALFPPIALLALVFLGLPWWQTLVGATLVVLASAFMGDGIRWPHRRAKTWPPAESPGGNDAS